MEKQLKEVKVQKQIFGGSFSDNGIQRDVRLVVEWDATDKKHPSFNGCVFISENGKKYHYMVQPKYNGDFYLQKFPAMRENALWMEFFKLCKKNAENAKHSLTRKQFNALKHKPSHPYVDNGTYLESKGLLEDNGYRYGTAEYTYWTISRNDVKRIKDFMAMGEDSDLPLLLMDNSMR